jgi:hypothetical protein
MRSPPLLILKGSFLVNFCLTRLSNPSSGTSYRVHFTTSLGPDTTINLIISNKIQVVVKFTLIDSNAEMPTRRKQAAMLGTVRD